MLRLWGWILWAVIASATAEDRQARGWFDRSTRTLTKVQTVTEIVTEMTPSSCVVVQTSLPPCRHLRAVNPIQPSKPVQILQTPAPAMQQQGWKPIVQPSTPIHPTAPGTAKKTPYGRFPSPNDTEPARPFWSNWNIFNLGTREVYVTSVTKELITTKLTDPKTVITFSVKGCRPSRLPFDLPECFTPQPENVPLEVIETSPIPTLPPPKSHEAGGVILMAPVQLVPNMPPIVLPDLVRGVVKHENVSANPSHVGEQQAEDAIKNEQMKDDKKSET